MTGPEIMVSEVNEAIKLMKSNKAGGRDGVTPEILKALDEKGIKRVTELCNLIYTSGEIPEEIMESIFINIPKKPKSVRSTELSV